MRAGGFAVAALFAVLAGGACLTGCRSERARTAADASLAFDDDAGAPDLANNETVCSIGVTCAADRMTLRNCTIDGPGDTIVDNCQLHAETCVVDHCANACDSALTETSNEGCEFWPVHLWNQADDQGISGPFGVVASNTSTTTVAEVTLEDATSIIGTHAVAPGTTYTFMVDTLRDRLDRTQRGVSLHLRSTTPIAAYEFNPVNTVSAFTGSASLLLPTHTLATHYYVMSYTYNAAIPTSFPQGQGYLAVVATEDSTHVTVKVPVATSASADGKILAMPAHGSTAFTLAKGEAIEIIQTNTLEDITGAEILSDRPVVAIGGSGTTTVPSSATGGDHFEAQLFPTTTWGKTYECEKYKQRCADDVDYWRVIAAQSGTTVTLSDATLPKIPTLSAGQMFEFATGKSFEMVANQPILVGHFIEAWGALSGTYDPAVFPDPTTNVCPNAGSSNDAQCLGDANMTLAVLAEQYRQSYVFFTPSTYGYDFVDVIAPIAASVILDGAPIPKPTPFGPGKYGLAQIRIKAGSHSMSGDMAFGITQYGYDYAISYTYPGGLDLRVIGIQ